jgi:hypothetical protein
VALAFEQWRHAPPSAIGSPAEQRAVTETLMNWSGISLPPGARVVSYSGEDERDGRYYYWILFYEDEPMLPGSLERVGQLFRPRPVQSAQSIEQAMFPRKIEEPSKVKDFGWSHGDFEMVAIAVGAKRGWYVWVDASRQGRPRASR